MVSGYPMIRIKLSGSWWWWWWRNNFNQL